MRASELLATEVVDDDGRPLGRVLDARLSAGDLRLTALIFGRGRRAALAVRAGLAEDRLAGPWLLRALLRPGLQQVRTIAVADVLEWGHRRIRVTAHAGVRKTGTP